MELIFAKAKWEAWNEPLEPFLARAAASGFTATEIYIPSLNETPAEIARAHADAGLKLVAQIGTEGETLADHLASLESRYLRATACLPLLVDCHTGSDAFTPDENRALFARALELERTHGVPLCHELHRGRALYNAPDTLCILRALPSLRINADFSHWQVVHESDDLKKHAAAVDAVIASAFHVHARVGFGEAPQIPDPRAPSGPRRSRSTSPGGVASSPPAAPRVPHFSRSPRSSAPCLTCPPSRMKTAPSPMRGKSIAGCANTSPANSPCPPGSSARTAAPQPQPRPRRRTRRARLRLRRRANGVGPLRANFNRRTQFPAISPLAAP